jgi:hypothetical protein
MLETQGRLGPREILQELNLDVSAEELLSAERAFTYADLYAMIESRDTIAWLTPHTVVARFDGRAKNSGELLNWPYRSRFDADGKTIIAFARSHEHFLEICDVVILRLLAVSVVQSVQLLASIDAPTLAYLMEQCQSLKVLSLHGLKVNENHCRVLGAYTRQDLEIEMNCCKFTRVGTSALVEILRRNQGPTKLDLCEIDNLVLANGLRGNSRLKSLTPRLSGNDDVGDRQALAVAGALRKNKGLIDLDLNFQFRVSDDTWGVICDSLKTHPTLEVLDLSAAYPTTITPAALKSRIQALVDMLKVNMSIHTMGLHCCYRQHELFRESVIPYLETNRLRPRLLTIQRTRPIPYRAKVLGRALLAVRTDPNRFWMLLSGNAEVAFPSTTATTTAATSLPTPANVAATENATPIVATASATAASSVVASTASQKRKAYP